jgi:hypothetical protein
LLNQLPSQLLEEKKKFLDMEMDLNYVRNVAFDIRTDKKRLLNFRRDFLKEGIYPHGRGLILSQLRFYLRTGTGNIIVQ